jgi:ADP-heptose:LPS heptosyltransferase
LQPDAEIDVDYINKTEINDFKDTAEIMTQMDLIISIDTSVAHLAGALGKPTWLLLPLNSEWRWLVDRTDTPWYPSMTLFRQPAKDDWETVFNTLYTQLQKKLNK